MRSSSTINIRLVGMAFVFYARRFHDSLLMCHCQRFKIVKDFQRAIECAQATWDGKRIDQLNDDMNFLIITQNSFMLRLFLLSCISISQALVMSEFQLDLLAAHANSYASANGIQVERRRKEGNADTYFECAPMSLLPNAFPNQAFQQAQSLC